MALLRYYSCTVQSTHLSVAFSGLVYLQNFASITPVHFRAFLSAQKKSLYPLLHLPFSTESSLLAFAGKGLIVRGLL